LMKQGATGGAVSFLKQAKERKEDLAND